LLAAVVPAAAAATKHGIPARSASRIVGANERVNLAHIGVGGNGFGNLRSFVAQSEEKKDVQVVVVCDVYTRRKERARAAANLEQKDVFHDYRELLSRPDVDAVFISVPDHWHAQMSIDAMAAGKDVYLQKPMTLTTEEARAVWDASKKFKRILQVGSQHVSDRRYHAARELIRQGAIGELLWAQGTYSRNSLTGEWNYYIDEEASPETIDWKRWLGPAPKRAFSAERYFRWRKYWDYSGGIATDLFYHKLGPIAFMMDAPFPTRVTAAGGIYVQKDREVPDTYQTTIEYPNFYVTLSSSMANAAANRFYPEVIYGHKGSISFEAGRVLLSPEPVFKESKAQTVEVSDKTAVNRLHTDNFLECVRSREQPVLNPELGYKVMAAIRMGVDSYRDGQVKFINRPTPRPGYEGDGKNSEDSRYRKRG
jgi:predicted dehydrogenase